MDIQFIRANYEIAKQNQRNRYSNPNIIDEILNYDKQWKELQFEGNKLRKFKNKLSESFKNSAKTQMISFDQDYTFDQFIKDSDDNLKKLEDLTKEQLKNCGKYINQKICDVNTTCEQLLQSRDKLIHSLGNLLHKDVVLSNNENDNKIIFESPNINRQKLKYNHVQLGKMLDIIDCDNGIKVAGNRGYFLTGVGVKLNLALLQYASDFLEQRNYKLMQTPHIVEKQLMAKITQLSEYEETLYKLDGYDKFLIATSEQPLTAYFNNRQVEKNELPIKFAGLSECYRKESGRHGQNTLGIFRVHQFQKIEQFCVTEADKSHELFQEMIDVAKTFYESLEFKFRIINIVSGALNNSASIKFDIEAYFPGSDFFGELVSCTNCLDYFSKRLNTKIKSTKEYVHMLNCTLMANTRVLCCIMETYQTENGIIIPNVLQKYMNCDFIKFK